MFSWLILIGRGLNQVKVSLEVTVDKKKKDDIICIWSFSSGGDSEEDTPVPIPNTEV